MIGKREQKKRIKDCLSQLKYLDSVYAAEIKKPEAEQDADLLEECLETMSYLHDVVESLSRQTQNQRSGVGSRIVLRRVAIVAIALAVLLIGMSVAEAAGFRVWSALIHWDSSYLHITYVPEKQDELSNNVYQEGNESSDVTGIIDEEFFCNTIDELVDRLNIQFLHPYYLPESMDTVFVSYYLPDDSQAEITIKWESESEYIMYYVSASLTQEKSISLAYRSENDNVSTIVINNTEYYVIDNQISWVDGNCTYSLISNLSENEIERVLLSLSY